MFVMKKAAVVILCLALSVMLLGCTSLNIFGFEIRLPEFSFGELFDRLPKLSIGKTETEKLALEQGEAFLEALEQGDWDAVEQFLPMASLAGELPIDDENLLSGMLDGMSCKIKSVSEQEDGSVKVEVEVETVDMLALLNSLPASVDSVEAAREEMLKMIATAPKKTFEAGFALVKTEEGGMEVQMDVSFANALSGGMYDILQDLMEGAMG